MRNGLEHAKNPEWSDVSRTSMYGLTPTGDGISYRPTPYDAHARRCWDAAKVAYEKSWRVGASDKHLTEIEHSKFAALVRGVTELHWAWLLRPEHRALFSNEFVTWIETHFVDGRVAALEESGIAGRGVRASMDIKADQFMGFLHGTQCGRDVHTLQIGESIHLLLDEPMRFLNHRPTPTANAAVRGRTLFACTDIGEGEEITIDYACTEDEFSFAADEPNSGYQSLSIEERHLRADRLHVWLVDRQGLAAIDGA